MEGRLGKLIGVVTGSERGIQAVPGSESNGNGVKPASEATGRPVTEVASQGAEPKTVYFMGNTDLARREYRAIRGEAVRRATGR